MPHDDPANATMSGPMRMRKRRFPSPSAGWLPIWYACEVLGCSSGWLYTQRRRGVIPPSALLGHGRGPRIARWWVEGQQGPAQFNAQRVPARP